VLTYLFIIVLIEPISSSTSANPSEYILRIIKDYRDYYNNIYFYLLIDFKCLDYELSELGKIFVI
jgi:hypothetical protein